jgi:hypothetical protein
MLDVLVREANTAKPMTGRKGRLNVVEQRPVGIWSVSVRSFSAAFSSFVRSRRLAVPRSILEAIKQGDWNFEPNGQQPVQLKGTGALPGTTEKLDVLADRLRQGLPLWHPSDRLTYDERDEE